MRQTHDNGGQVRTGQRLGLAWLVFCLAFGLHVMDESLTGFLNVYNPTVVALARKIGFWPMPTFTFNEWLFGLIAFFLLLLALSPVLFRNQTGVRPFVYFVVIVAGVLNALGHIIATVLGHTVSSITFPRPAPGFYSSPFLLAAAIAVLVELRRTAGGLL